MGPALGEQTAAESTVRPAGKDGRQLRGAGCLQEGQEGPGLAQEVAG